MSQKIYQLYAELNDFKPKVWRRFLVSELTSMSDFAYIMMSLFEMEASHLFCLEAYQHLLTPSGRISRKTETLGKFELENEWMFYSAPSFDARKEKLNNWMKPANQTRLLMTYDFGDSWHFDIQLERVLESDDSLNFPRVVEGFGYGIVEDSGGFWGLSELCETLSNKNHENYEEIVEWLGDSKFDITSFNLEDANYRLQPVSKIFKKILEQDRYPTSKEIDLLERRYEIK